MVTKFTDKCGGPSMRFKFVGGGFELRGLHSCQTPHLLFVMYSLVLCLLCYQTSSSSSSVLSPRLATMQGTLPQVSSLESIGPSATTGAGSAGHPGSPSTDTHSRVRRVSGADITAPAANSSLNTFTKMSLEEYVHAKGGNRVINKILIANNGIAAVKAIRSMRRYEQYHSFPIASLQLFYELTPSILSSPCVFLN